MDRYPTLRIQKVCFVFILIAAFIAYYPPLAFSTGREFERTRTMSVPSTGEPLMGGEIIQYYLAPADVIDVFIWRNPDLSREATIRPDGKISYPLIGTIMAAGLTIDQLQYEMKERFSRYIRSPEVTVSVEEFIGNKIIILGAVGYAGIYTYKGTLDLVEAIAMAGDFTNESKRERVIVVSDNLTMDTKVRRVILFRVIRKGTSKNDIILKPNNIVYVTKKFIATFN